MKYQLIFLLTITQDHSNHRVRISRRSLAKYKLSLTLSDKVSPLRDLRSGPDPVIIAVARSRAGRPVPVQIVEILAGQALRAGLLEGGIALALPLHRIYFRRLRLPIVGELPGGATHAVPRGWHILTGIVGGVRDEALLIVAPQRGHGHRHCHSFGRPVVATLP